MPAYCSECIGKAEIEAKSQALGGVVFKSSLDRMAYPLNCACSKPGGVLPNLLSKASKQMKVKIYFSRHEARDGRPSI